MGTDPPRHKADKYRVNPSLSERIPSREAFRQFQGTVLVALITPACAPLVYYGMPALVTLGRRRMSEVAFAGLTMGAAAVAGWALFRLRESNRLAYGSLEIAFALWYGYVVGKNIHDQTVALTQWATLAGVLYIMVRGLDNLTTGWHRSRDSEWFRNPESRPKRERPDTQPAHPKRDPPPSNRL